MRLKSKVAIITGANRGIGESIAMTLAAEGASVMLSARDEKKLQSVSQAIQNAGGKATYRICDVADEAQVESLIKETITEFGQLDILINNAGMGIYGPLETSTTDEWDSMMKVNARGPYLLCRYAIPYLRLSKQSFIINIGSVVSHKGYAEQAIYTATKHALLGLSKALAKELQKDGIRVHAICPGGVATELVSRARPDLDPSVLMQPQDVADAALFLLTRQGRAVIDEINLRRESSIPWA